ncbi:hypothetical protein FDG92_gp50 [Arthrobacter phage Jasmine]|uniref:Uncharacterized protein n=1 Tax=Arthrobacter phage Jasmine TaxID=1772302 RepID=A0A0U3TK18_9CAUD|nr:hypothetical protein FDG92_gp50 [Arthrobacter phage Jasmine]ALY09321.1 hypothetical protein JASMINE_51 [Arthrobacter phage Jasmine]
MYEKGDSVSVNLGGTVGTVKAEVTDIRDGGKTIFVQLVKGGTAMLDPWDVFPAEEED